MILFYFESSKQEAQGAAINSVNRGSGMVGQNFIRKFWKKFLHLAKMQIERRTTKANCRQFKQFYTIRFTIRLNELYVI